MTISKAKIEKARSRPSRGVLDLDQIPASLRQDDRWVNWSYNQHGDKWTKVPIRGVVPRTRKGPLGTAPAKSNDPKTWRSFDHVSDVIAYAATRAPRWREVYGVGYMLQDGSGIVGIDIDDCRDPATGDLTPAALEIIRDFDTYTEVSPSGTGVKLFLRGKKSADLCKSKRDGLEIEVYERTRFLTMTGDRVNGTPDELQPRQEQLDALTRRLWPDEYEADGKPKTSRKSAEGDTPLEPIAADLDDATLIDRIKASGQGEKFTRLMDGDVTGYAHANGDPDRSAADMALATILAFWVGADSDRIERLMRASKLAREKWDRNRGYLPKYTIPRAIRKAASRDDFDNVPELPAGFFTAMIEKLREHKAAKEAEGLPPVMTKAECDQFIREQAEQLQAAIEESRVDEAEGITAEVIRACRSDHRHMHCDHAVRLSGYNRDTYAPSIIDRRCEKWSCPGCKLYNVLRYWLSASLRWATASQLYEFGCDAEDWTRVSKRLNRADARYWRVRDGEGWWVICDRPVVTCPKSNKGAVPIGHVDALATLDTLLRAENESRPASTSQGWGLIEPDTARNMVIAGRCRASDEQLHTLAAEYGATYRYKLNSDRGTIMGTGDFIRPEWTAADGPALAERAVQAGPPMPDVRFTWKSLRPDPQKTTAEALDLRSLAT